MRRYGPALLLVLTGSAILRISLFSALYLRYVQAALRPYLVVSGVVLVVLGVLAAVVRRKRRKQRKAYDEEEHEREHEHEQDQEHDHDHEHEQDQEHDHDHDHDPERDHGHGYGHGHGHHGHGPRIAWLLVLPALALLLFPPPALGSYSASREAAQRAAQGVGRFPALPAGDPVALSVAQFSSRAMYDSGHSLTGRTVRMTGFVTHGDDGTWYVTRLLVSCCAADATTSKVEIRGAGDAPPSDTWMTVTGTWHPQGRLGTDAAWPPVLDATSARQVKQPADPYEKR